VADADALTLGPARAAPSPGDPVPQTTAGAPAGTPAAVFLITFDGSSFVAPIAFGTLDSTGIWSLSGVVPSGLSGHACTLMSFAIGFKGKVVDSGRMKLMFE